MSTSRMSIRHLGWIVLGTMIAIFLASTVLSIAGRVTVGNAVRELNSHILPVQEQVESLRQAYVDQETGQRGFMLTGSPLALEPFEDGIATAQRLVGQLRVGLAGDQESVRRLDDVVAAAQAWEQQAAQPQIAARRAGVIAPAQLESMTLAGKKLFDALRAAIETLDGRTSDLISEQIRRVGTAQTLANVAQIVAAALLVVVGGAAIWLLHRSLTRPVNNLVRDVRSVADGDYDQSIETAGPREIADIATAVETMRENLREATGRLLDSERRNEQARLAADLHDRVIQRVFGLGLALTSAHARRSRDLEPFIDETDEIIRDLREVIFNLDASTYQPAQSMRLRTAIIDVLESSVPALGFTPTLHLDGPIDQVADHPDIRTAVLAVVRESLSNIARHAQATAADLRVTATEDQLRIQVRDNGIGVTPADPTGKGRRNIASRARELKGRADIRTADDGTGTVVEWVVPLSRTVSAGR